MTNSNDGGHDADPFGQPPIGPDDYPDPSAQQSSFPQLPGQPSPPAAPPPGQFPPPASPSPGQYPPPGQQPPPAQYPGQQQPGSPFEPPVQHGSAPYGAGLYPPAAPQKKRRIWPWLLLGIPLLFAVVIGGCSLLIFGAVRGPVDATNNFVANLDNGDFGAAYDSLCSANRTSTSRDQWTANAAADIGGEITGYSYAQVEISGDAVVTGTIEVDGVNRTSVFRLVEEDGEWRVCE